VISDKRIFNGDGKAVTDMKIAVGVGRWEDDGVGISLLCGPEGAG